MIAGIAHWAWWAVAGVGLATCAYVAWLVYYVRAFGRAIDAARREREDHHG